MDKLLKIGPVILALRDFPLYNQYPFRDWKLDAFAVDAGQPDITVRYGGRPILPFGEPLLQERSGFIDRQLFCLDDGTWLWQQTYHGVLQLQFTVSPHRKCVYVTADETNTFGMAVMESLTFLIFYLLLQKNVLSFHGVLLEEGGRGIILSAPSGVGKSTQARLWRDHKNALILNGDRSCCYLSEGQWRGFGTPWCGTSGEYINRQVPIRALVVLEQGYVNQVTHLKGSQLLHRLMPNVLLPQFDADLTAMAADLLSRFVQDFPVLLLSCTPDTRAVDVLYDYLENLK